MSPDYNGVHNDNAIAGTEISSSPKRRSSLNRPSLSRINGKGDHGASRTFRKSPAKARSHTLQDADGDVRMHSASQQKDVAKHGCRRQDLPLVPLRYTQERRDFRSHSPSKRTETTKLLKLSNGAVVASPENGLLTRPSIADSFLHPHSWSGSWD